MGSSVISSMMDASSLRDGPSKSLSITIPPTLDIRRFDLDASISVDVAGIVLRLGQPIDDTPDAVICGICPGVSTAQDVESLKKFGMFSRNNWIKECRVIEIYQITTGIQKQGQ